MTLLTPQVLLLLLPLGLVLYFRARVAGPAMWLRAALLLLLTLALAQPRLTTRDAGSDLVVVVDRSRSMPPRALAQAEELIRLLEPQRGDGDRLGVISFGREPRVEMPLSAHARFSGFTSAIDAEASNLAGALDTALELLPPTRAGRVLVVSDGRATGLDARAAARRLFARGIAVDVRLLAREDAEVDVAVTSLEAPPSVSVNEPFLLTVTLKSVTEAPTTLTLLRNGQAIVRTQRTLRPGATVLSLRDLVEAPGLATYELRATSDGDGVIENDVGRAVVRVEAAPRVLLVTDKPGGTLARTLREEKIDADVIAPTALHMARLEGIGAVVLEDVEAGRLSEGGLHVLSQYVTHAGGGLVMTGGRHSFGEGGYRKSPIEPLLPVSLELREEQRKAAIAMAIILDCSCSMGMQVPDGRTKMELAAEGVVGALQLLNANDEASVAMVDTEVHEIFPMSPVADGLPLGKVARGFSGGGGIYVGEGLYEAKRQILRSKKQTRHVLLFSDAADSEEPGDYEWLVAELTKQNVTVSVIGMGTRAHSDAALLEDIARRGNGRIYFAEDVAALPRIFSQETIAVARATFVEEPTPTAPGQDLTLLGRLPVATSPTLGGYNLTYVRPQAGVALRTVDEHHAPVLAFWQRGAGRVAALTAEVDGEFTGAFAQWPGQRSLLAQVVRWALPPSSSTGEVAVRSSLTGSDLHVTLEVDPTGPPPAGTPTLVLLPGDAKVAPVELPMRWEEGELAGAHFVLPGSGTWHPVVKLGAQVFRSAPVTLPWVPEFEPAIAGEGRALLLQVAKAGGGVERLAMAGLFSAAVESETAVPLAPWLLAVCVALLLAEVLLRRFYAAPVRRAAMAAPAEADAAAKETPQEPTAASDALRLARERAKRRTGS